MLTSDAFSITLIVSAVSLVVILTTAVIIAAYRNGSLQADIKWVRSYIRIYRAANKKYPTTN